jgi:hypothetical protein
MFTGGRNIYDFEIRNLEANAGLLTPQDIVIDVLDILPIAANKNKGVLVVSGRYAQRPLSMTIALDRKKTILGHIVYKVPQSAVMELMIDEVSLKTDFVNEGTAIWFRNGELSVGQDIETLKDSAFIKDKALHDDNIMLCLLAHDYKNIDEICEAYIKEPEQLN